MTKKEIDNIIETGEIPAYDGYWFETIMGCFYFFFFPIGTYVFSKDSFLDLPNWLHVTNSCLVILDVLLVYWITKERKLKVIETNLSKEDNRSLLLLTFKHLKWKNSAYKHKINIDLNSNPYILRFLYFEFYYRDNSIRYNIMYHGYRIRFPAFFGIQTYIENKFLKVLKKNLIS